MKMAKLNFKMEHLLTALNMDTFYPEKLTIDDLNEITALSVAEKESVTQERICQHFINRLTRYNYQARNLKVETQDKSEQHLGFLGRRKKEQTSKATEFHPLDILIVIFLCCDPVAKQDFVKYLWECKLSVPFVVKVPDSQSVSMYKWPLRSLVAQWQGQTDKIPVEYSISEYPMQTIGVVRVGTLEESKSALLNGLIGGSEKAHPMFFHRNSYGSKRHRSELVHGMIELGWYLPNGSGNDTFDQCLTFANLRGDAAECPEQLNMLVQTVDLLMVMSHTRHLLPASDTLRTVVLKSKASLLILVDKEIREAEENRIESLMNVIGDSEIEFEILPLEDKQLAEKLEYINTNIKNIQGTSQTTANEIFSMKHATNISIDQHCDESVVTGIHCADMIINAINQIRKLDKKSAFLPFQGANWKRWTEIEIESHRLHKYYQQNIEQDIASYRNTLELQKHDLRKKQYRLKGDLSPIMKRFLWCLTELKGNKIKVFLRALKLGLDNVSRKHLRPFFEQYQEILRQKMDSDKDQNDKLNEKLEKLDKEKNLLSIGLEHFTRELGQIFEACVYQNKTTIEVPTTKYKIPFDHLPDLAAIILLNGYPVEIMDGDVGFVPEKWVKSVLAALKTQLMNNEGRYSNPKLHVISVLGIQSSGKSTLLNTLFGLQFAVSAGRCTKGVFMQVVKVNKKLRSTLKYDYILVIDTEGLRSAQLSSLSSIKFDNELSCFAIGLADTTVVNLMGENSTYLEENLPIVVHAFLRMDMAGLRPHCMIVHHNVDKRNKQKLMEQGRVLEKVLNDLTAKACDMEKISPHKLFKDIIEFDIEYHTNYIPALLEGEQPMGSRSIGYSQECVNFLRKMIAHSEKNSRRMNITRLSRYLLDLWTAMQNDQFVFEFKSTLETQTRVNLDKYFCKIYKSLVDSVSEIEEEARAKLLSSGNTPDLEMIFQEIKIQTLEKIDSEGKCFCTELVEYIEDPDKMHQRLVSRWKEEILSKFNSKLQEGKKDCINNLHEQLEKEMSCSKHVLVATFAKEDKNVLNQIIEREISKSSFDLDTAVDRICSHWFEVSSQAVKGLVSGRQQKKLAIQRDVEKFLREIFGADKYLLEKNKSDNDKSMFKSLDEFAVESKHISGFLTFINKSKVVQLTKDVITVIREETAKVLSDESPYSTTKVRQTVFKAMRLIESKQKFCTQTYKVDIALAIGDHVVRAFLSKNEEDRKKKETMVRQTHREFCIPYIREFIHGNDQAQVVLENCASSIVNKFIQSALKRTLKYIHFLNICSYIVPSREKMEIVNLLIFRAIKNKQFDAIDSYTDDPKTAVISMLCGSIEADVVKDAAAKRFSQRITIFLKYLKDQSAARSSASLSNILLKTFKLCSLSLSAYDLKTFSTLNLNTQKVVTMVIFKLRDLDAQHWRPQLVHEIETDIDAVKYTIAEYFISNTFGCNEKCPFCNEVCMFSDSDHDGPHETTMHRPIGCKGYYCVQTNELSVETCSNHVASRSRFKVDGEFISFKGYSKIYPHWKIKGSISLETSMLWKWYFAQHRIKKWKKNMVIPSAWELITEENVLHYLSLTTEGEMRF